MLIKGFHCNYLNKLVCVRCSAYPNSHFKAEFFDEDGCLLCEGTLPNDCGGRNFSYFRTQEYPWLYDFVQDISLGYPTHNVYISNGIMYERFRLNYSFILKNKN